MLRPCVNHRAESRRGIHIRDDVPAFLAPFTGDFLEELKATARDVHLCAIGSKTARYHQTDTGASARHERYAPGQVEDLVHREVLSGHGGRW